MNGPTEHARIFAAWLAAASLLAACGGGGSAGGAPASSPVTDTSPPVAGPADAPPFTTDASATSPSPPPPPAASPPAPPPPPPASIGETPPSNDDPQPGSTTAVGSGVEGLWVVAGENLARLAFVDAGGRYLSFDASGVLVDGAITLAGTSWTFAPGTVRVDSTSGTRIATDVSGSGGTVGLRHSFQGTAGSTAIDYAYSTANALAVSQADAAATWLAAGASMAIDAAGALGGVMATATVGDCSVTGTATLAEPGSRKNLYALDFTLSHAPGGTCRLDVQHPYTGYAAIAFVNVGTAQAPSWVRALTFVARTPQLAWLWGTLRRS